MALFTALALCAAVHMTSAAGRFEMEVLSTSRPLSACLSNYRRGRISTAECVFGSATTQSSRLTIPFPGAWPVDFNIVLSRAADNVRVGASQSKLIGGQEWTDQHIGDAAVRMRFICDEDYYGSRCNVFCRAADNSLAHFTCSTEGQRVCKEGWTGPLCNQPVCEGGCGRGECKAPGVCECDKGFAGAKCDQCQTFTGCEQGTCDNGKPFTCKCKPGYGGLFCNKDLEVCTRRRPCQNGGVCSSRGLAGEYECACPRGFTGKICEVQLTGETLGSVCRPGLCMNGGLCQSARSRDGFRCECAEGFAGKYCDVSTTAETTHEAETTHDAPAESSFYKTAFYACIGLIAIGVTVFSCALAARRHFSPAPFSPAHNPADIAFQNALNEKTEKESKGKMYKVCMPEYTSRYSSHLAQPCGLDAESLYAEIDHHKP